MEQELMGKEQPLQISELNAFELTIQEHEKELDFVPDMTSEETRKKSAEVLKLARKTWNLVNDTRLDKKKEAEVLSNSIHQQGLAILSRLEVKYNPHKSALDKYKDEQKAIEQLRQDAFNNACEWLRTIVSDAQFSTTDQIKEIIKTYEARDQDNTGADLDHNQKFEYGKLWMATRPKLDELLQKKILSDIEDKRQQEAALELEANQAKLREEQEAFEREQKELRDKQAADQAKENAERDLRLAAEKAEREKEQAVIDERNRLEDEQKRKDAAVEATRLAEEAAIKRKADNKKHQASVNNKAIKVIMKSGIDEDKAREIVISIITSKDSSISINY